MNAISTNFGRLNLALKRSIIILILFVTTGIVSGEPTSAVELLYLRGAGQDQAVLLQWATATELNTAGFRFERGGNANGPFTPVSTIGFVPAISEDGYSGAEYERLDDENLVNGNTYWYVLIEIEYDSTENRFPPMPATAGTATPTSTAIPTSPSSGPSNEYPSTRKRFWSPSAVNFL